MPIRSLEVIVKVAERCNIACSYCYYFYHGDESFKSRPKSMSHEVAAQLGSFLRNGCRELGIPHVKVVFHGGEPLMLKRARFESMCELLRSELNGVARLELAIQTNAVLLDLEWATTLRQNDVRIGVSIDGSRTENDRYRVDHRGRGTYDRVVSGLRAAQRELSGDPSRETLGTLTVLNADYDYTEIFRHFAAELGVRHMNFLLPDCSYEDGIPGGHSAADYGRKLCEIFDAWAATPGVSVREVEKIIGFFQRIKPNPEDLTRTHRGWKRMSGKVQVIVVQSDGALSIDDTYIPAMQWRRNTPVSSIYSVGLAEYLEHPVFAEIDAAQQQLPTGCQSCVWQRLCAGGDLENRFSKERGFDNPSIFCEGLKMFYAHVARFLVHNGYPRDELMEQLLPASLARDELLGVPG